jgi:hypothetical protein
MQIGRITGLSEPQGFSQPDMSTVSFGLLATATEAKQLLDLGSNGAERFVPIVFGTALAANDGVYELLEVGVEADPNMEAAGLRQVSVSARCENQGRQVANSQLLVRGDNRNRVAAVGLTGPLYRAAIQSPPTTITSYNAGPAGFTTGTVSTLRGDVVRLVDATKVKAAVTVASTANITLSGTQTVDGVSVSVNGTRVLVKNQTTKSQNGIYTKQTGAWTRATDADGTTELDFAQVGVASGTANGGTTWFNPNVITIGTTAYDWQQAPAFGLRESDRGGPVSISYQIALADWYDGACTITQGGTVVTGTRVAATGVVSMDNGVVKVLYDPDAADNTLEGFVVSKTDGSAFGTEFLLGLITSDSADAAAVLNVTPPSVLMNTPDVCALRYRFTGGSVDVSISRGSQVVVVAVNFVTATKAMLTAGRNSSNFSADSGFFLAGTGSYAPEAPTAAGWTAASAHIVGGTSNQGSVVYGSGVLGANQVAGTLTASTVARRAHVFGYLPVDSTGSKTGDDELYGLSREFFAMLAQQTSAGVL